MRLCYLPLLLLSVVLALLQPTAAQQLQPSFDLNVLIERNLAPGMRLASLLDKTRTIFGQFDLDRDGAITSADRERSRQTFMAAQRPNFVTQILSADLDGDGVVTR
jgi:hypothetical protein